MVLAPRTAQNIPDRFSRPSTVLQPASMTPEPTHTFFIRFEVVDFRADLFCQIGMSSDNSVFVRAGRLRVRSVNSGGEHFPQRTINWEVGLCVREIRSWY
jgi:hypothetical protein